MNNLQKLIFNDENTINGINTSTFHGKIDISEILKYFGEDDTVCTICGGKTEGDRLLFLDGNTNNFLVTNLLVSCKKCSEAFDPMLTEEFVINFSKLDGKVTLKFEWPINTESLMSVSTDMKNKIIAAMQLFEDYSFTSATAETSAIELWRKLTEVNYIKGLRTIELWETNTSFVRLHYYQILKTVTSILMKAEGNRKVIIPSFNPKP